jgi:hypothetical protein
VTDFLQRTTDNRAQLFSYKEEDFAGCGEAASQKFEAKKVVANMILLAQRKTSWQPRIGKSEADCVSLMQRTRCKRGKRRSDGDKKAVTNLDNWPSILHQTLPIDQGVSMKRPYLASGGYPYQTPVCTDVIPYWPFILPSSRRRGYQKHSHGAVLRNALSLHQTERNRMVLGPDQRAHVPFS